VSSINKKISVLLVDDHPVVRKGLQTCLARHDNLNVVGEACDGIEALAKAKELRPDVMLTDISMPRMDGIALIEAMRKEMPSVKILVLSVHANKDYLIKILKAGALGYVSKEAPPEVLCKAIQQVNNGQKFVSPELAQSALVEIADDNGTPTAANPLTEREQQVLVLIAEGKSNKEIASALDIGVRTIETHRERIMRRLDIHSVAGLTKYALTHGLITLDGNPPRIPPPKDVP